MDPHQVVFRPLPAVTVSGEVGAAMIRALSQAASNPASTGLSVSVSVAGRKDHGAEMGTSMAAAHVSAVAALVWAVHPQCTVSQLRGSLARSARDLGPKGPDPEYGFGLVQAYKAAIRIHEKGCGN